MNNFARWNSEFQEKCVSLTDQIHALLLWSFFVLFTIVFHWIEEYHSIAIHIGHILTLRCVSGVRLCVARAVRFLCVAVLYCFILVNCFRRYSLIWDCHHLPCILLLGLVFASDWLFLLFFAEISLFCSNILAVFQCSIRIYIHIRLLVSFLRSMWLWFSFTTYQRNTQNIFRLSRLLDYLHCSNFPRAKSNTISLNIYIFIVVLPWGRVFQSFDSWLYIFVKQCIFAGIRINPRMENAM